jgi:hypothetical protein
MRLLFILVLFLLPPVTRAQLDASHFANAGDMSQAIQSCLAVLSTMDRQVGVCDARGFHGNQTWSINPFTGARPASGTLLLCGASITVNVPIVLPNMWSMEGCVPRPFIGQTGTVFQASATNFPTLYNTGTVTITGPAVVGTGTAFTSKMVGCALFAPGTEPVNANSTAGYISAVADGTHLTLKAALVNGTGAVAGSAFNITCPVVSLGDGGPAQFANRFIKLGVDCNNLPGCVGIRNWNSQEHTIVQSFGIRNYTNIGLDLESGIQNSGPYEDGDITGGAVGCTTATIPIVIRGGSSEMFRGIRDMTIAAGSGCANDPAVGIDADTPNQSIENIHFEHITTAIEVGGNVKCPVSCAVKTTHAIGTMIKNIEGGVAGKTLVDISNAQPVAPAHMVLMGLYNGGGYTNVLTDPHAGCTETATRLGFYTLNGNGAISSSTSITAGCH